MTRTREMQPEMKQMMKDREIKTEDDMEPSPTWTSTSSCDAARLVAFAVAESALLDSEADEGYSSFSFSYSKNQGGKEERIVNLNTPPSIPTHTFPPSPFDTPPPAPIAANPGKSIKNSNNLRPDAPVFSPPHHPPSLSPHSKTPHTRTPIHHTRTRSDLLPAIALSTQPHRRIASTSSPLSSSNAEKANAKGDLPFPRMGAGVRRSRAGMPTLAEITAYYATRPAASRDTHVSRNTSNTNSSSASNNASKTTSHTSTTSSTTTTIPFTHPRTRAFPAGESMQKRCSLSSNSSGSGSGSVSVSGWSSADSEGPRTPPAEMPLIHHRIASEHAEKSTTNGSSAGDGNAGRRESASRLPTFLRAASPDTIPSLSPENGKPTERSPYNALATALARHRRTVSASSRVHARNPSSSVTRTQTPPPLTNRTMFDPPRRAPSLDAATPKWTAPTPERRRTEEMPGIQVTPPSSTIPHVPAFSRRPIAPSRQSHIPSPVLHAQDAKACLANSKPSTEHLTMDFPVPNLRLTPPTAIGGQSVSPLRRLEAEVQQARETVSVSAPGAHGPRADVSQDFEGARRREAHAERMLRILGKRTGVASGQVRD